MLNLATKSKNTVLYLALEKKKSKLLDKNYGEEEASKVAWETRKHLVKEHIDQYLPEKQPTTNEEGDKSDEGDRLKETIQQEEDDDAVDDKSDEGEEREGDSSSQQEYEDFGHNDGEVWERIVKEVKNEHKSAFVDRKKFRKAVRVKTEDYVEFGNKIKNTDLYVALEKKKSKLLDQNYGEEEATKVAWEKRKHLVKENIDQYLPEKQPTTNEEGDEAANTDERENKEDETNTSKMNIEEGEEEEEERENSNYFNSHEEYVRAFNRDRDYIANLNKPYTHSRY